MEYKNTILNFEVNVPTTIVLDIEPARVVGKDYTSKAGRGYRKYTYFTQQKEVFFALEGLHKLLAVYHKGDTLTITNMMNPGSRFSTWKVEPGGAAEVTSNSFVVNQLSLKAIQDTLKLVGVINNKLDALTKHFNVQQIIEPVQNVQAEEKPNTEPSVGTGDIPQTFDKDLGF